MRSACQKCGFPAGQPIGARQPSDCDRPCRGCSAQPMEFDQVVALWSYQDLVCDAVVAAKSLNQAPLADALGRRLAQSIGSDLVEPVDCVTFVPAHVTRQISRGGSGCQIIAQAVAGSIGRPCRQLLRLKRRIAKQAWLNDSQRLENVRGVFCLKKSYAWQRRDRIANQHILLVDDVLTTGATANEITRVLRSAGVRRVTLAVVARAVRTS